MNPTHKLSGIHTLHVEFSQNYLIPEHFWNPGILESWNPGFQGPEIWNIPKCAQNQYKYIVKITYILKSLNTSQFQVISGILESKSKNYQRYHKNDIFQLLRPNSRSVTKIKLNWCPICQNWQKIGHFHAISRVPENFWKFPGMMKFWNPALKIKFLD